MDASTTGQAAAQAASHKRLHDARAGFVSLLAEARLPTAGVQFSQRQATFHEGQELLGTFTCPAGHEVTWSLRQLREALDNRTFNDPAVVPHLCPRCAYPSDDGSEPVQHKATLHHRLHILRTLYPKVRHVGGFDTSGKAFEHYSCGETFRSGDVHPSFSVRYDKLALAHRSGELRHACYVCGARDGTPAQTKDKTPVLLQARMQLIEDLLYARGVSQDNRSRPQAVRLDGLNVDEPLSTTTTRLRFQCGDASHKPIEAVADNYFKKARGGYCPECLRAAGVRTTAEL